MNLQIIGEKSIKKVIAVADDILEQDENEMTLTALRQIIAHCGLEDRYRVEPTAALPQLSERWIPYILVKWNGSLPRTAPHGISYLRSELLLYRKRGGCHLHDILYGGSHSGFCSSQRAAVCRYGLCL